MAEQAVDLRADWPKWDDEYTFRTPNLTFSCSWHLPGWGNFSDGRVPIHKTRSMINHYRDRLQGRDIKRVAEIGYLHGGMVLFLADMQPQAKIVGIDLKKPAAQIVKIASKCGMQDRVKFYGRTSQDDKGTLRNILDEEFGDALLDLIIEDASHFHEQSKASFEACFGYLRPGAHYFIEDWGWAHWDGAQWQESPPKYFSGKTSMTQFIFELCMFLASRPQILSRLDIRDHEFAVATRGDGLAPREPIDLDSSTLTAGRRFLGFNMPSDLLQELEEARRAAEMWQKKYRKVTESRSWKALSRVNGAADALRSLMRPRSREKSR